MIRIVLLDDHPLVRRGLRETLSAAADMILAGEASNAAELWPLLSSTPCDVLLLDLSLPDRSGIDVLKDVRRDFPRVRVLVVSTHDVAQYGVRSLRAGAAGYISKSDPPTEIVRAVRDVAQGGRYVSDRLANTLADFAARDQPPGEHHGLTDRELDVLRRLVSGRTISEIAADLSLSVKTVSTYRVRMSEKLGLRTATELVRYAVERRLFE